MKGRQRQNRFSSGPGAVYVRCSVCGGKFERKRVLTIAGKVICGVCKLINDVWKQ